jgi:hypothetical protein
MWKQLTKIFSSFILILTLCFGLLIGFSAFSSEPAAAAVEKEYESPGQVLYKSRHSLRDRSGNSWQLIFFKRYTEDSKVLDINLRVVGFPGVVEVAHPQPLQITTYNGDFLAEDMFAEESPASNVGQYDLQEILPQLPTTSSIRLLIPNQQNGYPVRIPASLVLEWQSLAKF